MLPPTVENAPISVERLLPMIEQMTVENLQDHAEFVRVQEAATMANEIFDAWRAAEESDVVSRVHFDGGHIRSDCMDPRFPAEVLARFARLPTTVKLTQSPTRPLQGRLQDYDPGSFS
jgi:hypothetical protein